jgi:hypothetical protein
LYAGKQDNFRSDVVFAGGTTYVFRNDTVYTDNIIEMHCPEILQEHGKQMMEKVLV